MLHPVIPFITEYLFNELFGEKILESEMKIIDLEDDKEVVSVDCLLLLTSSVRNLRQNRSIEKYFLELMPEFSYIGNDNFSYINKYLKKITHSEILQFKSGEKDKNFSFIDLKPFGILWYKEEANISELKSKLKFYESEFLRSKKILDNESFVKRAPVDLINKEREKLSYYQKQKEKIANEIRVF